MAKLSKSSSMKAWREGELIKTFKLNRILGVKTPLMEEWLHVQMPELDVVEQANFNKVLSKGQKSMVGWSEEDLKMKFISVIVELGNLSDDDQVVGYYDKTISATVEGIPLVVKSDFMLAQGILNVFEAPYFHFQEYKPQLNPSGEPMAQLLEAFLIAQVKNQNGKPLYGIEMIGKQWTFVIMEGKNYCISKAYDAIDKSDLLTIIAILRKFRHLLETRLMN
ncbi:MAG: hypothetical protein RLZZ292_3264 [Bacteroidota bacterium]|jgi:hypothetical protein